MRSARFFSYQLSNNESLQNNPKDNICNNLFSLINVMQGKSQ